MPNKQTNKQSTKQRNKLTNENTHQKQPNTQKTWQTKKHIMFWTTNYTSTYHYNSPSQPQTKQTAPKRPKRPQTPPEVTEVSKTRLPARVATHRSGLRWDSAWRWRSPHEDLCRGLGPARSNPPPPPRPERRKRWPAGEGFLLIVERRKYILKKRNPNSRI